MTRALRLARHGLYTTSPNPRVGCVIVKHNEVVGEGWHVKAGGDHAEVVALKQAGDRARGATCYVTLEPCSHTGKTPPCTPQLIKAGIVRVIVAMVDPNPRVAGRGIAQLQQAGIEAVSGLLEAASRELNAGFIRRMTIGMPWVRCKLAASLDGRIALANGESKWITGEAARADVQRLRAQSCAILTGIGTVLADDPLLTVRGIDTQSRQPLRVIIDRQLRTPPTARLLDVPGSLVILTAKPDPARQKILKKKGAAVVPIESDDFLREALRYLAREHEINEVLVEAGQGLSGSLFSAGLVDELIVYQAPVLLGHQAKPMLELPGIERMDQAHRLALSDMRRIGDDFRFSYNCRKE